MSSLGKAIFSDATIKRKTMFRAGILIDKVGDGSHFDLNKKLNFVDVHLANLASLLPFFKIHFYC